MIKKSTYSFLFYFISFLNYAQNSTFLTTFEKSSGLETATYFEVIDFYKNLARVHPEISVFEMGKTDSGFPLHLVVYDSSKKFDFKKIRANKTVVFINNGIHPGESDGIDASMMLLRDIVQNRITLPNSENFILAAIPIYNIGGALNRNSTTRVNQNGPKEYGFRGNARNFDLNRDFIKSDTKNTRSFAEIFHLINPDVFIETHVSNGADYQYAITHLFTQHNKLGGKLGAFLENEMRPQIEESLLKKDISITPYVNVWGKTPDTGFSQFFDSPRYSSGFATLFNTFSFMIETHMLKPYKQRVEQTYSLLESAIEFTLNNTSKIEELRINAVSNFIEQKSYPIQFTLDEAAFTTILFKGYEGSYINSKVTTGKRLFYDQSKPFTKPINYYNQFKASKNITIPKAYILKQGFWPILDRLNDNKIEYIIFKKDTSIIVEVQTIKDFKTINEAFEGHYMHYNTEVLSTTKTINFNKGDVYIPVNQNGARYLFETLEAEAIDSFFNWNFFDSILQEKEGYSAYVFEDIAEQFLIKNPEIKELLQTKITADKEFANNPQAQLDFIYKNSPYYEAAHLKLPIYKVF
ncbi:M14 family metallopeptidase [Lutibacter sp.]|uniref:M14 family metallopeptidase n=1 Tax=Lutibacter sp. TaxID=1925666 RepID=UPI00273694E3|nr:M14 family metallopeptidase [Lutibacter sp.]MDP3311981.1 M14 family metallopeptidase [Lutibacter sp.]